MTTVSMESVLTSLPQSVGAALGGDTGLGLLQSALVLLQHFLYSPVALCTALALILIIRFLHVFSAPAIPEIQLPSCAPDAKPDKMAAVRDLCPALRKIFRPPRLWGRNGHLQTAFYGVLGHATLRRTFDRRHFVRLGDGTVIIFDVFEPLADHPTGGNYTLALTPGIANSSESNYIRTAVHYAQEAGYRCAVLNHLGAIPHHHELTTARIFSYGETEELESMMGRLVELYPRTKFVMVGFSMGANITTLFASKVSDAIRHRIIAGMSVCQGYDALRSIPLYHEWEGGRRIYNYIITENVKRLLRRNYERAVLPHVRSGLVDEAKVWQATSIVGVDEHYTRVVHGLRHGGFATLDHYYNWCSSLHKLDKLRIPMLFLNALDDPLIPPTLWMPAKRKLENCPNTMFVLTKHGGHLGFLEGHSLAPSPVTWLDRFICEYANAAIQVYDKRRE